MIADRLNMPQTTISERILTELVDLLEAIESRLNFKNPADLTDDKEMPTPDVSR